MKTINELKAVYQNAPKMLAAINSAIADGYGEYGYTYYYWTAYATHPTSNAAKARMVNRIIAEYAGPRAGKYRTEGHRVLCVIAK